MYKKPNDSDPTASLTKNNEEVTSYHHNQSMYWQWTKSHVMNNKRFAVQPPQWSACTVIANTVLSKWDIVQQLYSYLGLGCLRWRRAKVIRLGRRKEENLGDSIEIPELRFRNLNGGCKIYTSPSSHNPRLCTVMYSLSMDINISVVYCMFKGFVRVQRSFARI